MKPEIKATIEEVLHATIKNLDAQIENIQQGLFGAQKKREEIVAALNDLNGVKEKAD
jgi:hypothetical protein